jgi:hypothetical protein
MGFLAFDFITNVLREDFNPNPDGYNKVKWPWSWE